MLPPGSRDQARGITYRGFVLYPHIEVTSSITTQPPEGRNLLASPHMNRDAPGRDRSPRTVTAAEKAQAHEVSLRRIGRLFRPYRWQLGVVTAIIAASSVVGLASPLLLRAVIDTALPERNVRLLAWLVIAMVGVAAVTSAFG